MEKQTTKAVSTWRRAYLAMAAVVLIAPLVAMRWTRELNWSVGDFLAAGFLLATTWAALEVAWRLSGGRMRAIATIAILLSLLAVWAQLAVGIFN